MLTDSDAETLGFPLDFPSTWRTSKAVAAATSQTEPLSFSENETQTVEYIDAHVRVSLFFRSPAFAIPTILKFVFFTYFAELAALPTSCSCLSLTSRIHNL